MNQQEQECKLVVERQSSRPRWLFGAVEFEVFGNGKKIGTVKNGNSETFLLPEGSVSVRIECAKVKSQTVSLNLAAGQREHLVCGANTLVHVIDLLIFVMVFGGYQVLESVKLVPSFDTQEGMVLWLVLAAASVLGTIIWTIARPGDFYYLKSADS